MSHGQARLETPLLLPRPSEVKSAVRNGASGLHGLSKVLLGLHVSQGTEFMGQAGFPSLS